MDGTFGPTTEAAVRAFQREKKVGIDGIAGPRTCQALIDSVKRGSKGDFVRGAQEELNSRDLPGDAKKLRVDGIFGPLTEAATNSFQKAIAAEIAGFPVDKIVGPNTWQALAGPGERHVAEEPSDGDRG
ncbi:peptidoglycan-binding domain-containing protein [Actinoplanes sp. CA-051413]|uniref:peptidoglycan-binding domain-containing protein n=1 Tax=Actinoplanes sp. CA-051413 TaxID=3239899 RepID=UPI003D95612F